ncbi:Kinetochore protein Spc24 [Fukomys damarensis]|uniref:Kinetochore protein Spc24 n=1 Tax=Fukomys damarensis TaxID=885580 RepID=A0A091D9I3_FUKDA|nr:Kinetochore protein Spc24 [Fukomys damarensis]
MAAFRDIEEVSQGLLSLLGTNHAQAQQRRLLGRHEQILERLLEMQDGAEQQLRETLAVEEKVAQSVLDTKERVDLEAELDRQEREVDEDTTVTIPAAVYVAQLYRRISKIEWDYECEPGAIRGIHHGPSVAQPVHLDSFQLSKQFVSDHLWSLVDTEW